MIAVLELDMMGIGIGYGHRVYQLYLHLAVISGIK
jgi:hypothetical protein